MNSSRKRPWLVRMHHRMRSISFAMMFVATVLNITDQDYGPLGWSLLVCLFLIYPHLQYCRACWSANPVRAEMTNLLVDSLLLGVYIAGVGFSLWLAFSGAIGTLSNNAANKGWRGVFQALLALGGGMAAGVAIFGLHLTPRTEWPATLFCIAGLTGYLMAMGNIGFNRNQQLRQTRETLKQRESDLLTANHALQENIREIAQLHAQLIEQANRDPLTNLYNRRYLDSTLDRELARCKREGQSLALIMIDIDHFKKINDTYGHQAGDEMLIYLASTLHGMARAADITCRYGGEEFLLLMPTMDLETAHRRAEELRAGFGSAVVPFGNFRLQTTLSIGISVYPGHGTTPDQLIQGADRAMYRAKHRGRNRVEIDDLDAAPAFSLTD